MRTEGASAGRTDPPADPGLCETELRAPDGAPYVGSPPRPLRRFAREPRLERVLRDLHEGFGPQRWWPARTPFEVIAGAVLVQNTAWRNAARAVEALRAAGCLAPAPFLALGAAEREALVRPSGTYRVKARRLAAVCRWYLERGGLAALREQPLEPLRRDLLGVPGVGPETADAILCYAAGRATVVVDAYCRRVLARHGLLALDTPYERVRRRLLDELVDDPLVREEFHALCVRAGYDHCKPVAACAGCPAAPPEG